MDERIITWNLPNLVSIWLMIILLWVTVGFVSHLVFRKGKSGNNSNQKPGVSYSGSLKVVA